MEYLVGILLSLATVVFAAVIGLDRERSFYSTVLFVIATYYVLFAVMGASRRTLMIEIAVASGFFLLAVLGFKGIFGWWRWLCWATEYLILSVPVSLQIPECHTGGRVSAWHLM